MTAHGNARVTFAAGGGTAARNVSGSGRRLPPAARDGDAFDSRHAFTRMDTTYLARDLCNAFVWAESADGHAYWADVHTRLRAIAATAPVGDGLPMDEPAVRRHEAEGGVREAIGFWGGVSDDDRS